MLLSTVFRLASNTFSPCFKQLSVLLQTALDIAANMCLCRLQHVLSSFRVHLWLPSDTLLLFFKYSFRILPPLCCEPPNTLKFLNEHSLLLCVHCFCSWFALVFLSEKHPFVFCEHRFRATRAS